MMRPMSSITAIARRATGATARTTIVLILLIGVSSGFVQFAAAGARRTASVFDRFVEWSDPATVALNGLPEGQGPIRDVLDEVEALPAVEDSARLETILVDRVEVHPGEFAAAPRLSVGAIGATTLPASEQRLKVLEGELPSAAETDAAMIDFLTAEAFDLGVGDMVTLEIYDGTRVDITVAAVVSTVESFPTVSGFLFPSIVLPPAFAAAHPNWTDPWAVGSGLWLRDGVDGIDRWVADMEQIGLGEVDFQVSAVAQSGGRKIVELQSFGLDLAAIVAGLAGLVVIAQLLGRQRSRARRDLELLGQLGMHRRDAVVALALRDALTAAAGTALAVALSIAASPLTPFGLARKAEVAPGFDFDLLVTAIAVPATVVFVVAIGAAITLITLRAAQATAKPPARSRVAHYLGDIVGTGWRMAFGARRALSPAVLAPAFTLLAAVAVGTCVASISGVAENPALSGGAWDAFLGVDDETSASAVADVLGERPEVKAFARGGWISTQLDGSDVFTQVLEPGAGVESSITRGEEPVADDEIALGAEVLDNLGLGVGSTVEMATLAGEPATVPMRVVGEVVLASPLFQSLEPDAGALISDTAYAQWLNDSSLAILVDFDDRASPHEALEQTLQAIPPESVYFAFARTTRGDVLALGSMVAVPWVLAGFLAVLTIAALAQWCLLASRRERHDAAVLRALGWTSSQLLGAFVTAGFVVALFAAAAGSGLGLIVGREVWGRIAAWLLVVPSTSISWTGCLLAAAATTGVAVTASALAGSTHTGTPARHLRAE
jgi:hypothetical protein